MNSAKAAFNKFGRQLTDPDTGVGFVKVDSLKVSYDFKTKSTVNISKNDQSDPFAILDQKWVGVTTVSSVFKSCVICGTTSEIEMHHIRRVANVRRKFFSMDLTFKQWQGAVKRKQIPLCKYHHDMLHNGKLSNYELSCLARYSDNLQLEEKEDSS